MASNWTISDAISRLSKQTDESLQPSPTPTYDPSNHPSPTEGVALAVKSMQDHMSDEGYQIMQGLEYAGYRLCGYKLPWNSTDVNLIINSTGPGIVVVQDKREWDVGQQGHTVKDFRDPLARFRNVNILANRSDIFKLTILKDAHQRPHYHKESADEIGCHAWIVYYNPLMVCHLASYVRPQHVVRTYHSLDNELVPPFSAARSLSTTATASELRRWGCLISGAMSSAYPLRQRLAKMAGYLPATTVLPHPGYHRNGCATPDYLRTLSKYRVAICTSSIYGYALRKIIEATACGCVVLTDLPQDEVLPEIDDNLARVHPDWSIQRIANILSEIQDTYNPQRQEEMAARAQLYYSYRAVGTRLAADIESLRQRYGVS